MNKASGKLKKIQELCLSKNIMISTAESCTGGYLSKLLTDISGSSKFYVGSVIAYSNSVKNDLLNVPNDIPCSDEDDLYLPLISNLLYL